ncbi:hypothetical protein DL96DRAFT_1626772 [Flagelloscypha sp. PMI_526]|nr:hypothetical protein DL96DRAFT_1626772 [Flagelloscypha sp. PMI_526]
MPSSRVSWHEIRGPLKISLEQPRFFQKDLEAIENSLRTNSTIPELSTKDLEDIAAEFQKQFLKLQNAISDLEDYLQVLNDYAKQLQIHEGIARDARAKILQPFPPLPVDLVRDIVLIAAGESSITAKSLSLVSKQIHEWSVQPTPDSRLPAIDVLPYRADQVLWGAVFVDEGSLRPLLALLHDPVFASTSAFCVRRLQTSCDMKFSRTDLHSLLSLLPNIELLSHWAGTESPNGEDVYPTLRRISCSPCAFSDVERMEFISPFFQNMTHIDVWTVAHDFKDWSSRNWASLKTIHSLTHLLMDMRFLAREPDHFSCVEENIVPALPPSVQIVILQINRRCDAELASNEVYNKIREGAIDRRVLLCVFEEKVRGDWVLMVGTKDAGRFADGRKWLNTYGEVILWKSGVDMLRRRNDSFGL